MNLMSNMLKSARRPEHRGFPGRRRTQIVKLGMLAGALMFLGVGAIFGQSVLFFDDFAGPKLDPTWQASLPDAHCGSIPYGSSLIANCAGAPEFDFRSLGANSVVHIANSMGPLQRRGWSSSAVFVARDFRLEARFNTLNQSPTSSIDAFIELWLLDANDDTRYDIVSPYGGGFGTDLYFFTGSSLDKDYPHSSYSYQNNTWYRLVLEGARDQNIRASLCDDNGKELIGRSFRHSAGAFCSGFKIVLSQAIGASGVPYPVDVAVDYVKLTTGGSPSKHLNSPKSEP